MFTNVRVTVTVRGLIVIALIIGAALFFGGLELWQLLFDYIAPEDATGKKDVVQTFGLIVAGAVGLIGAIVGLGGLYISRKNLQSTQESLHQQREIEDQRAQQQREIEDQRAQDTVLQAFYQQMGDLLTKEDLINTDRKEISLLARAQTLTVLRRLAGSGKGDLLSFLYGAGLINREKPIIELAQADLSKVYLQEADLRGVDLRGADLSKARLSLTNLRGANLSGADLSGADLIGANLDGADLNRAYLIEAQLGEANLQEANLQGAYLQGGNLLEASLQGANLQGANLQRADFFGAKNLAQKQVDLAIGDENTNLPEGLERPKAWTEDEGA